MSKKLIVFTLLIVVILVFYYSWLPDSQFRSENYLPRWLVNWSNNYYNLRTSIPFIAFGYLLQAYSQKITAYKDNVNKNLVFIKNLGVAAFVAIIAECGQFLVKGRSPDLMDIYFGIVGSLIGASIYSLFNKMRFRHAK